MPRKDSAFIFKGAMLGVRYPKVADRVPNRVRHRLVLVNPIQTGSNLMVEGERVPCEPPARNQAVRDPLERAAPI